jgi:tRNA threonylcarbamoyladenosine biosynthesis protein TsaB
MSGWLLAIDTATRQATVTLGTPDGRLIAGHDWPVGHTHAETLLPALRELLAGAGVVPADLTGIVAGTGPGGFTGLRVGLATAKTLAHGLGIPIAGIATTDALAAAALAGQGGDALVLLPAGPSDRYFALVRVARDGTARAIEPPRLLAPADVGQAVAVATAAGARLVPVDLPDAHAVGPDAAIGQAALAGLGAALLRLGARALATGRREPADQLVPTYVTLPRGVAAAGGGAAWSPDLR